MPTRYKVGMPLINVCCLLKIKKFSNSLFRYNKFEFDK